MSRRRIPILIKPEEDEFIVTWLDMIAGANAMSTKEFIQLYFDEGYISSNISITELDRICKQYANRGFPSVVNIMTKHSKYQTIMPFLSHRKNILLAETIIRSREERILIPVPLRGGDISILHCPECLKEDKSKERRPYVRAWHNLPGVSACYRHGCKLININMAGDSTDHAEEEEIRYAEFLYCVYLYKPHVTLDDISELISETETYKRIKSKKYISVIDVVREFCRKFTSEQFLNHISSIERNDCKIVGKKCSVCGHYYHSHGEAESFGYGCPLCDGKMTKKELLQKRLDLSWNRRFELTDLQDNSFNINCRTCGTMRCIPLDFQSLTKDKILCHKCDHGFIDRNGETGTTISGLGMKIIRFINSRDMDVQFSDGVIARGISYGNFKKGLVCHPEFTPEVKGMRRTGEKRLMSCGMEAEIIEYRSATDIDVRFSDGAVVRGITYVRFKEGYVCHPDFTAEAKRIRRTGEKQLMSCGMDAEIAEYRSATDIDVRFLDGTVVHCSSYADFKNGYVCHPDFTAKAKALKRKGEKRMMNCGMEAEIIAYRKYDDIDVCFLDGAIVAHTSYDAFVARKIRHPSIKINIKQREIPE